MHGRHRNGEGIDPETGTGTVIGLDGKEYRIGPGADLRRAILERANLREANLSEANLTGAYLSGARLTEANLAGAYLSNADLMGANFYMAEVDPEHIPLIEAPAKAMIASLKVNDPAPRPRKVISPGRAENPGYGYNYDEDPYDDYAGGFGYGRMTNPGHGRRR